MNFMLVHTAFPRSTERDSTVAVKLFFLCVDTITLTCVLELAVRTLARSAADYASTATGMLVIVVLGGAFLHAVIAGHTCSLGITTKAARGEHVCFSHVGYGQVTCRRSGAAAY